MVLVVGDLAFLNRTGMQPLHRAPADPGGKEYQSKSNGATAAQKRKHGYKIEVRRLNRKARPDSQGDVVRWHPSRLARAR